MAPGYPLYVNGYYIRTSEALYQACRFPHRPEVQRLIIEQTSPMTAKMRSKPFRSDSRPDWDRIRISIMRWCLRVKLANNWTQFGNLLTSTGNREIVEHSRNDDFWGATHTAEGILSGVNALGRLLMELREELINGDPNALRKIFPLRISNFLLFGESITVVEAIDSSDPSTASEGISLKSLTIEQVDLL